MNIGKLTIEMAANVARLQRDLSHGVKAVDSATAQMGKMAKKAKSAIGGIAAGLTVTATIKKLVDVQRQFDILNSSLVTVTGSTAAAQKEFKWIKTFAATTPYALNEVTQAFVKMKALGLDASQASLTSYGNTASAMGKDLNQMIEAVADAATGEFERLKEFGIKARKSGDDVSFTFQGVTTNIKNNAADITKYLTALGENQFAGAMARRAETLDGAISNLGDTWDELFRTVNDNATGDVITASVRLATGAMEDAILVINALGAASKTASGDTGALSAAQDGLAVMFEAVTALGLNVKYVLVQMGKELGGIAAQAAAFLTGDWEGAAAIGRMMRSDAAAARQEVDAQTAAILNARKMRDIAARGEGEDEPRFRRMLDAQTASTVTATAATVAKTVSTRDAKRAESALAAQRKREAAEAKKIHDDEQEALQRRINDYADEVELRQAAAVSAQESVRAQRESNEEIGLTAVQLDAVRSARTLDEAAEKDRFATIMDSIDPVVAKTYRDQADALRELAAERTKGVNRQSEVDAARDAKSAADAATKATEASWEKTADQISQSLTDALMKGFDNGEDFATNLGDSITNMFKTWVARAITDAIKNAIMSAMAGTQWGNLIGSAFGGGGGGGFNWIGAAQQAYSAYSGGGAAAGTITNGMSQSAMLAAQTQGMGTAAAGGTASTMSSGGLTGMGYMGYAALIAAAVMVAEGLYKKGWNRSALGMGSAETKQFGEYSSFTTNPNEGQTAIYTTSLENINRRLGDTLGISEKWVDILSGSVRMAATFGRKLDGYGFNVNMQEGQTGVSGYAHYKGGLFRSNKTKAVEIDPRDSELIQQRVASWNESTKSMARALGASDEAIEKFTGSVKINFKGAETAGEQAKRVAEAMETLRWQMFQTIPGLEMARSEFDAFMEGLRGSIEAAGMGAGALTDIIVQGMTGRMDESQVGEALATTVLGGIYNTLATPFAAEIANAFSTQIIEPVMAAALAGVPIAQAVSSSAIANVVETAKRAAATLNEIFSNEEFQAAIKEIYAAIGQVSRITVKPSRALPRFNSAIASTGTAADDAARKLKELKDAWTGVTDSLLEEIRRIRGEMGGNDDSLAFYKAQFAMRSAQARAGDVDAAKEIPGLSQRILEIGRLTATSATDLRLMEGSMMANLERLRQDLGAQYGIDLPAFASGTNYVSQDMAAIIHKGEQIVPARYNPDNGTAMNVGSIAEVFDEYGKKMDKLINAAVQTVLNTGSVSRSLERVVREDHIQTKEVT